MRTIWTIAVKDLKSQFVTPIGYLALSAFLTIMGWMFFFNLKHFYEQNFYHSQNLARSVSIADGIVRPLYGNMNVILLFTVPFITMGLFAAERRNQTIQLLMTSPVTILEMILGKYLSVLMFGGIILLATLVYPLVLFLSGNPDPGPILSSLLGTFLMAGCFFAVGVFCSSTTENQIIAAALTFFICLFFWLLPWASNAVGSVFGDILQNLGLISHFNNFSRGIINTGDCVYYLSFIGVWLFFTYRVLDSLRWRS